MVGLEPDVFAWLMVTGVTVTSVVAYLPQIVKLVKRKSSEDISLAAWLVWLGQYIVMSMYAFLYTTDIVLFLAYVIEGAFCAFSVVLILRYRKREKDKI